MYHAVILRYRQSSLQFSGYGLFFFPLEQMDDGVTQYVTHTAYLPGTKKAPISQHTEETDRTSVLRVSSLGLASHQPKSAFSQVLL